MERYTYFENKKWRVRVGDTEYSGPWVDRLAAYEEIELEPDLVQFLAKLYNNPSPNWLADRRELAVYRAKIPFARLDEAAALVKARDEGRAVVLDMPRKPLVWGDDEHETCICPDCGADLMGIPYGEQRMVLQCPACGQYLDATKAITRAEAEAALGGGGDG